MKTYHSLPVLLIVVFWLTCGLANGQDEDGSRWWKGNLHTHSLWSDGNDFPEMITKWYADRDYHFLALSDHNVLSRGERWMDLSKVESRGGKAAMEKYLAAFAGEGADWVEIRDKPVANNPDEEKPDAEKPEPADAQPKVKNLQVRLRALDEFRGKFEVPGKFLIMEGEEISDKAEGFPVHLNATNLSTLISPVGGATVQEAINNNIRAVQEQAEKNGQPIFVHLNHPNFRWAITGEELAAVTNERFFEVYNGSTDCNNLGDETRPGIEKMWDIANTIRIDELKAHPMFGLATDDSHNYHNTGGSTPGRGWIMVRSKQLSATSLIEAMNRGEFYFSTGVELESVQFDRNRNSLSLKIKPQPGVTYSTQFIGTMKGYDKKSTARLGSDGKPMRATRVYSADVGAVLATSDSLEPVYSLTGDELFVRAVVTSSQPHPDPVDEGDKEQAWTQPVGWGPRN